MHETDKMLKIENMEIKSHQIQKITQRFALGNPYRRKPS
jgi:hypothetical protein